MPPARKILIADPDAATVRALAPALRQRGYQVHAARDGSRALQIAILRFPDLVLLDEKLPAPRRRAPSCGSCGRTRAPSGSRWCSPARRSTRTAPGSAPSCASRSTRTRCSPAIEQIFRRADAARAVSGESREIEGNLAQIPLVDLLQILAVNRKTGRLTVEREGERAEIALAEGRVVDARMGAAVGEKALCRLLTRREGQFAFVPGRRPAEEPDRAEGRGARARGAPPGGRGRARSLPGAAGPRRPRRARGRTRARSRPASTR